MGRYRIGRADTNDIVLVDTTVSREHAEIVALDDGRFHVKDLGSTYGIAIRNGAEWQKVTEAELAGDAPLRIGDYETTVGDLMRNTDRTVVRPRAGGPPPTSPEGPPSIAAAAPPEPAQTEPARTEPPRPAPPKPPRPAGPRPAAPRAAAPGDDATVPPQPASPAFRAFRNLPPDKRPLVWVGVGFAAFLTIALITLILALVL